MDIHFPKLIPGVFLMGIGLFGYRLIASSIRGAYAVLAAALTVVAFLYGVRLVWAWLEDRKDARREVLPSREQLRSRPWLKVRQWRRREVVSGRLVGNTVLVLAYLFIGLPALFFFWLAIVNPPARTGEDVRLVLFVLGALLAFIVGGLTYWRLRHLRYGDSVCRLITLPGRVGGWLKADVECALPADSDNTVVVRLKNMVPAGKRLAEVWRMEQRAAVTAHPGARSIVNVRLQIPRDPRQKLPPARAGAWDWLGVPVWILELEKKVPGIDFQATFAVPVYDVPDVANVADPPAPERAPGSADLPDTAGRAVAVGTVAVAAIGFLAIAYEAGSPAALYRPSAEWMTGERFQREFDLWARNGYYPPWIEGRCAADGEQFRTDWQPTPPKAWFMAWFGMTGKDYERKNRQYVASGYSLESTTRYNDCSGTEKVQATWLKR